MTTAKKIIIAKKKKSKMAANDELKVSDDPALSMLRMDMMEYANQFNIPAVRMMYCNSLLSHPEMLKLLETLTKEMPRETKTIPDFCHALGECLLKVAHAHTRRKLEKLLQLWNSFHAKRLESIEIQKKFGENNNCQAGA